MQSQSQSLLKYGTGQNAVPVRIEKAGLRYTHITAVCENYILIKIEIIAAGVPDAVVRHL